MNQLVNLNNYNLLLEKVNGSMIDKFEVLISLILLTCFLAIFISVATSFINDQKDVSPKKETKSIVETGTMFLFFFIYYLSIRLQIITIDYLPMAIRIGLVSMGTLVVLIGTYVNVMGRYELGQNWANQIKIYNDHQLIQTGMYKFIRHPLYASLIWIFYGGSLVFLSFSAFLLNTFIFIPFMFYRAKQEENLLIDTFPEYNDYKSKVGMFFPKLFK